MRFEWDPRKALENLNKHGITFEEAVSVFADPLARIHNDPEHSDTERRDIIVGHSRTGRLLLVSFTERRRGARIISARTTTPHERRKHEEGTR